MGPSVGYQVRDELFEFELCVVWHALHQKVVYCDDVGCTQSTLQVRAYVWQSVNLGSAAHWVVWSLKGIFDTSVSKTHVWINLCLHDADLVKYYYLPPIRLY